jgi:hypothetical protein
MHMLSSSSIHRQSMVSECFLNSQEVNPSLRKPSTVFCTFITTFCQDLNQHLIGICVDLGSVYRCTRSSIEICESQLEISLSDDDDLG